MAQDYLDEIQDRDDRIRPFEFKDTTWTIKAHNPFSLWRISCKGPTPNLLSGHYTTIQQAELAITKFVNGKLSEPAFKKRVPKVKLTPKEPQEVAPKEA